MSATGFLACYIKSGSIGIISSQNEETAVPCPYNIIFGRDTALPSPLYHSGVTGIDITWASRLIVAFRSSTQPTEVI